jgi:Porin subfamily
MKMVKSLILGSAASLLAMGGAQAADLPVKAKPVEYVRICSLYGAGFWYIPGTDTCIRISGYFRAEADINAAPGLSPALSGVIGNSDRYSDQYTAQARGSLTFDTRTATEYGVVRGLLKMNATFQTNQNFVSGAQLASAQTGPQANELGRGGGNLAVDYAFVQFAGFTFGKAVSAYETPWFGQPANGAAFLIGGSDNVTGIPQIAYTAQFGNGVSATVAVEDGTVYRRGLLTNVDSGSNISSTQVMNNTPIGAGNTTASQIAAFTAQGLTVASDYGCGQLTYGQTSQPIFSSGTQSVQCSNAISGWASSYGGAKSPDFTGNVRFDSAFLTAQIAGAAHLVNASYFSTRLGPDPITSPNVGPNTPAGGLVNGQFVGGQGIAALGGQNSGQPDSKWGGAVQGGVQFKQLPTGAGDLLTLEAAWSKGATAYIVSGTNPSSFYGYGSAKSGNSLGSVGFGNVTDGVFAGPSTNATLNGRFNATGGGINLTEAWAFRGGFTHYWTPQWQTSIYGSWTQINYDNSAKTSICNALGIRVPGTSTMSTAATGGVVGIPVVTNTSAPSATSINNSTAGPSAGYSCNPNWGVAMVGGRIAWTPVKNLTFSTEVMYSQLLQHMHGQAYINPGFTSGRNSGIYDFANQSTVGGFIRAERQF